MFDVDAVICVCHILNERIEIENCSVSSEPFTTKIIKFELAMYGRNSSTSLIKTLTKLNMLHVDVVYRCDNSSTQLRVHIFIGIPFY